MALIPQQEMIALKKILDAPWNPPRRASKADRRFQELRDSMEVHGQLQAVLVCEHPVEKNKFMMIEGHRRKAVAESLGWGYIRAEIRNDLDAKTIYSNVNRTAARHNGNDVLGIYLADPQALSHRQSSFLDRVQATIGKALLQKIYRMGYSGKTYTTAKMVCVKADRNDPEDLVQVIEWLLRHRMFGMVKSALTAGYSAGLIWKAVNRDRPLKLKLDVG